MTIIMGTMDFETKVKLSLYNTTAKTGTIPTAQDVASDLNASVQDVLSAFNQLHQKRLLVPEPNDPSRIRMAPPFSGIPTSFAVDVSGIHFYANCVWDAVAIPAALHRDGVVNASDGHTGEPISIEIKNGIPVPADCIAHFAVPAALWWKDIIFT